MALASQRALLDELMGKQRNLDPSEPHRSDHWSDPDVCKYFLAGQCPHELFTNTRVDLGPCPQQHDERMLDSYKRSSRYGKVGYEDELYRYLNSMLQEVERKIRKGHARLDLNSENNVPQSLAVAASREKVDGLTAKINGMLEKMERLGEDGRVEEAQAVMLECEAAKNERARYEELADPSVIPSNMQAKELEVCEICGAFQIKGDAPARMEEHTKGRMHLGYARIREFCKEYNDKLDAERAAKRAQFEKDERERSSRDRDREKERDRDKDRRESHRDRDRDRDRDRNGSHKDRKRSRSRSRHRSHERERDRDRDEKRPKSEKIVRSDRERGKEREHDRSRHSETKAEDYYSSSRSRSGKEGDRDKERDRDRDRDHHR